MSNLIQATHTRLQDDMGRAMANLMMSQLGLILSVKLSEDNGRFEEVAVDVINGLRPDDRELDIIVCRTAIVSITKHLIGLLAYYIDDETIPEEERESWRPLYNELTKED